MSWTEQQIRKPCPTCRESLHRGLLWIGGKDYVECPDCGGTGTFHMIERLFTPTATSIIVPGTRDGLPAER